LTALLIGPGGCATVSAPPAPKPPVPQWEASKLIESLKQRNEEFRSLRALAQVDYAGPEGRHGFQEAVIVQRPNRLRLDTLTLIGAVLIFTANDKEIIGYHPREGVFVRGRPTAENLRRYTQLPLELPEITMLLMGLPPVDAGTPWKQEGNTLIFSPNGRQRDVLTFESHEPVPTKWERFGADGKVELSARFNDYASTAGGLFPMGLLTEAPLQKKTLAIRYKEPQFNGTIPPEQFTQQIPAHAKEVPIEAVGD
jgi:hypothetical protein